VRVTLTLSLLVLAVLAPAAQAATDDTHIIVGRDPGLSGSERAEIRRDAGVKHVENLRLANIEVVATDDPKAALAALRSDPDVRYAELDRSRHAFTNDPDYSAQWALENTGHNLYDNFVGGPMGTANADMDVPEAWSLHGTGTGKVAVVDSGIDASHPDLAANVDTALSRGFVGGANGNYADGDGHGTHVSGIIGALSGNAVGVSGIAPGVKLVALKALDDDGNGSDSDIAAAFDYAGDNGIPVVNASLGGEGASQTLTTAMASHPGTLYVLAAGNDGIDNDATPIWPCNAPAPNIVCVGASTQDDLAADFSNYGNETVDVFAPGEYIWSTFPTSRGSYELESGTSMASPAVAAEAALVRSARPTLTPLQVKATILAGGDAKPAFNAISVSGRRANARRAVALAVAGHVPADQDGDGVPDDIDAPQPVPDTDGDGVPNGQDACPTVPATTYSGCPAPATVTPAPGTTLPTADPGDADRDGRADALDLCPNEAAATSTGCPVPGLRSLSVKPSKRKHRATIRISTTRSATVAVKVERRVCNKRGKKCRWRKAYSAAKVSKGNKATFTVRKLAVGRYRVAVKLSSPAGRAKQARKAFKV
jgi:subtilisin family serine protease